MMAPVATYTTDLFLWEELWTAGRWPDAIILVKKVALSHDSQSVAPVSAVGGAGGRRKLHRVGTSIICELNTPKRWSTIKMVPRSTHGRTEFTMSVEASRFFRTLLCLHPPQEMQQSHTPPYSIAQPESCLQRRSLPEGTSCSGWRASVR